MRCQGGRADAMLLERWVKHEDSSRVTSDRSPFQPLGGGCMCERVRFEIAEPLLGALYCHCKRCQRRTGSAFSVTATTCSGLVQDRPRSGARRVVAAAGRLG